MNVFCYNYLSLCSLGIIVGHEFKYSSFFLSQYYLGVNKTVVFYKLKKIIFYLFKFKIFLSTLFFKQQNQLFLLFLFVFSKINQYLLISKVLELKKNYLYKKSQFSLILSPTVGFLSVNKKQQETTIFYNTNFFLYTYDLIYLFSFGDDVLPITAFEAYKKNIVLFGLIDTNQKKVLSGVDYPIFSTDDSVSVSYFFSLFMLNLLFF